MNVRYDPQRSSSYLIPSPKLNTSNTNNSYSTPPESSGSPPYGISPPRPLSPKIAALNKQQPPSSESDDEGEREREKDKDKERDRERMSRGESKLKLGKGSSGSAFFSYRYCLLLIFYSSFPYFFFPLSICCSTYIGVSSLALAPNTTKKVYVEISHLYSICL